MSKSNKRERRFRRKSILDILSAEEKWNIGLDEENVGIALSFIKKKNGVFLTFREYPTMSWPNPEILKSVMPSVGVDALREGNTLIFVGIDGRTTIHINEKLCNDDRFGACLLKEHLFKGFDLTDSIAHLKLELQEVQAMPMSQHIEVCEDIIRRCFVVARQHGEDVLTTRDVQFVLVSPEDEDVIMTPVTPDKLFVMTPLPLARPTMEYQFYQTWISVFVQGYREIIEQCFERVAREMRTDSGVSLPFIFPLPFDARNCDN